MEKWKQAAVKRLAVFWVKNRKKIITLVVAAIVAQLAKLGFAPDEQWTELITQLLFAVS